MVVHTFKLSDQEAEAGGSLLVLDWSDLHSSRTASVILRDPVSKIKEKKKGEGRQEKRKDHGWAYSSEVECLASMHEAL